MFMVQVVQVVVVVGGGFVIIDIFMEELGGDD